MTAIVLGVICVVMVLAAAWLGSVLIKAGQLGMAVGLFLTAALLAGIVTDNIR